MTFRRFKPRTPLNRMLLIVASLAASALAQTPATQPVSPVTAEVVVRLDQPAKPISPDLFGIFFEDLNYAADGGLYAELIQNRSFEYSAADRTEWSALTSWEVVKRGKGQGGAPIDIGLPLHANNPHYVVLEVTEPGDGVGLANTGFDGIAVTAGESYDVSLFASLRSVGRRWGGSPDMNVPFALRARLEKADGTVLAEAPVTVSGRDWKRYTATLTPSTSEPAARFVLLADTRGGVALDDISLFPTKTFKNRPNGLRADLAQAIADLKPKFIRFPGGCLAHGNGLPNLYRWKDTIGPIEQRRGQPNIWGYHQSVGLGYFEYFQFCEDIGAKPLPVVAAGVSCQNSAHTGGTGQQCLPMERMGDYVQEVLDLVEYANGPATSTWGAKRAAAGHPRPFGLKYLGIGNEDAITPGFRERFKMIQDAVRAKYPDVVVIGTVGPSPAGWDFEAGWKIADELKVPVVDEHYYESPAWFVDNLTRYDQYDRSRSRVYLGEYASRGNTLGNALAEAAYMTSLERNGDVVQLASYAPLLCKLGRVQWHPDLIYFDNSRVFLTTNYYVQKLFGHHSGDAYLSSTVNLSTPTAKGEAVTMSSVRDSASGDVILKLVNLSGRPLQAKVRLDGVGKVRPQAECLTLTGDAALSNPGEPKARGGTAPMPVMPVASSVRVGPSFDYAAPANSLTVLRIKPE